MHIGPMVRRLIDFWLRRLRQIGEQWFEIGVESSLESLVQALIKFFRGKPTRGEVITKGGYRTIAFGVSDPELRLLSGSGIHLAVWRGPHPHHVAPGKVEPAGVVTSHD
jgi:hypothetical protein